MKLESMEAFFTKRVHGYDDHMIINVDGCKEAYDLLPTLFNTGLKNLLDLGCGTGLQLATILRTHKDTKVHGIDLTASMLEELHRKFPSDNISTTCGSYFDVPFGSEVYDGVVSVQSFHHFTHQQKRLLYKKIYDCLMLEGTFVLCDYMIFDEEIEKQRFEILSKYKDEHGLGDDDFVHYDTPCTVDHEMEFLEEAGFSDITLVWQYEGTKIIQCHK